MRLLEIGKVTKTRGLKGTMKVASFLAGDDALLFLQEVFVARLATSNQNITRGLIDVGDDGLISHKIIKTYPHSGSSFFIDLEGVDNLEKAKEFLGTSFLVSPNHLPKLPAGEHYWFELLGMDVVSTEGVCLGKLSAIFHTGSNDVYVCRSQDGEILLPAIPECIVGIDAKKRIVTVNLLEGLVDAL